MINVSVALARPRASRRACDPARLQPDEVIAELVSARASVMAMGIMPWRRCFAISLVSTFAHAPFPGDLWASWRARIDADFVGTNRLMRRLPWSEAE
jgi:hypothetical protein